MHENMKTSMWHTGRSERTWRLPACFYFLLSVIFSIKYADDYQMRFLTYLYQTKDIGEVPKRHGCMST